jgi:hypothetical protein
MKAFWYNVDSNFSNHAPRGSGGSTIGKTIFTCVYIENNLFLQNQADQYHTSYKSTLVRRIKNCTKKGQALVKGEIITKCKYGMRSLKNFLLENHWARIAQLYMKVSWHGADSSLYKWWSSLVGRDHDRGNNFYTCILKRIFRMKHLANIKLGTNHSCIRGILVYSNEGSSPLQKGGGDTKEQ